ncbi:hypothetical protein OSB04_010139 [Centaurea solstitialis]|uniref:Uncharacterized protein n=1 Tax=Centaurea solstitialis TaxID=347529 RepID=A0AA38T6Y6_9ASTR|nr:hypothetical protein OSB04_010139 [Centaurea solstitialis]
MKTEKRWLMSSDGNSRRLLSLSEMHRLTAIVVDAGGFRQSSEVVVGGHRRSSEVVAGLKPSLHFNDFITAMNLQKLKSFRKLQTCYYKFTVNAILNRARKPS